MFLSLGIKGGRKVIVTVWVFSSLVPTKPIRWLGNSCHAVKCDK